jgi:PiT family inorganic phosphate transporter
MEKILLLCVLIALGGVIFVNGWTDAPIAIATCVCAGALKEKKAALLAALCNLLGIGLSFAVRPAVSATVEGLVTLPKSHPAMGLSVLLCGLVATGLWAVAAWFFGIPTSESHGLLAGLSGAALAWGGRDSLNGDAWLLVAFGLGFSLLGGLLLGGVSWWMTGRWMKYGRDTERRMKGYLVAGAAAMALMHGAQDGQKFIGIWMLSTVLLKNGKSANVTLAVLLCALLMGAGTLLGGGRIIRTLGVELVKTGYREGFAADVGAATCLLILTLLGMPVSTTHTKTAALMGVGAAKGRGRLNAVTVAKLLGAWLLTFPACFGAGYALMVGIGRVLG